PVSHAPSDCSPHVDVACGRKFVKVVRQWTRDPTSGVLGSSQRVVFHGNESQPPPACGPVPHWDERRVRAPVMVKLAAALAMVSPPMRPPVMRGNSVHPKWFPETGRASLVQTSIAKCVGL